MNNVIIIRYGEIFLKGKNRDYFESLLIKNIKVALEGYNYKFVRTQGRYFVEDFSEDDGYEIMERLKCVFGIYSLSCASKVPTNYEGGFVEVKNSLKELAKEINDENTIQNPTFRVTVKRADKRIPMKSYEIAGELAGVILATVRFKVSLEKHDYEFMVDMFNKRTKPTEKQQRKINGILYYNIKHERVYWKIVSRCNLWLPNERA